MLLILPGVAGNGITEKVAALTSVPPGVVTDTVPVVPLPIVTVMLVDVLAVMVAAVPPMVTDVAPPR